MPVNRRSKVLITAAISMSVSGCAVGPNYEAPTNKMPARYRRPGLPRNQ